MMSGAGNRFSWAAAAALAVVVVAFSFGHLQAIQPDTPFIQRAEKNRDQWKGEDEQVDARLDALYKRFGQRPNRVLKLE